MNAHPQVRNPKEILQAAKNAKRRQAHERACKVVGAHRITHHDLRHLFATRCIESDVDIPTVSRWLGHKDDGALLMKTYGHLRREHSQAQAKRVTFAPRPQAHPLTAPTKFSMKCAAS